MRNLHSHNKTSGMPFTFSNDNEGFSAENPKIKVWKFPNSIPNSPTTSGFFNRLPQFPENRKNNPCRPDTNQHWKRQFYQAVNQKTRTNRLKKQ
ncbi:MAG: hypothetical protein BGO42_03315 [Flavobacterium sp. 40-81]|nr:MAG: hypothetical protein BGO42_03315 [Flavobacterium sp. 40-81]